MTVYDPLQFSLEYNWFPHHASPNNVVFGTQPHFTLQYAVQGAHADATHVFDFVQPHDTYDLRGQAGQPWVLQAQTPLSEHLEYYFSVNDWSYTAYIAQELVDLPAYVQPHLV